MKQTILGAGGSIGNALAEILLKNGESVRFFSRSGFSIKGVESLKGDLTKSEDVAAAVKGSSTVFLCAGIKYNIDVWTEQWPVIMKNVIEACKKENAKLVFFDNVYMYGKVEDKMLETTPYNPCSKKGEVRAKISLMLENEIKSGNIKAIIARAADLYGPYATKNSILYLFVIEKLLKGKKANWIGDANQPHSFSYTNDCARGLYLLANNNAGINQIWHLPTFNPPISCNDFIKLTAEFLKVTPEFTSMKKWMVRFAGIFDGAAKESFEMLYQYEFPYYFDSTKFNNYFNFKPKSYTEGIKETIDFVKKNLV